MQGTFFAHSAPRQAGRDRLKDRTVWEPLAEHLRDVAERAAGFAAGLGCEQEARLAGLLHDLGKYCDTFTRRLEGKERGLDHWSACTPRSVPGPAMRPARPPWRLSSAAGPSAASAFSSRTSAAASSRPISSW